MRAPARDDNGASSTRGSGDGSTAPGGSSGTADRRGTENGACGTGGGGGNRAGTDGRDAGGTVGRRDGGGIRDDDESCDPSEYHRGETDGCQSRQCRPNATYRSSPHRSRLQRSGQQLVLRTLCRPGRQSAPPSRRRQNTTSSVRSWTPLLAKYCGRSSRPRSTGGLARPCAHNGCAPTAFAHVSVTLLTTGRIVDGSLRGIAGGGRRQDAWSARLSCQIGLVQARRPARSMTTRRNHALSASPNQPFDRSRMSSVASVMSRP